MTAWHGDYPTTQQITMPGPVWDACVKFSEDLARRRAENGIGPEDCVKARLAETPAEIAATAIRVGMQHLIDDPSSFDLSDGARVAKKILWLADVMLKRGGHSRAAGDVPGALVGIAAGVFQAAEGMTREDWLEVAAHAWDANPHLTPGTEA